MKSRKVLAFIQTSQTFRKTAWLCIGAMLVSFLSPSVMRGQLGIDTAAILAFLQTMNTTMQESMAVPLTAMQGIDQQESAFQQNSVYPTSQITNVQGISSMFASGMAENQTVMATPPPTALQGTPEAALESSGLSGDPSVIPNIPSQYNSVYGPPPTAVRYVNPAVQNAIDMGDAQAKDALAEAVKLDAMAAKEETEATQLIGEAPTSTPGTAPMIVAQASAWILQADAFSQGAMSELLRVRSASLSYQGIDMKSAGMASQGISQAIQNVITSH